MIDRKESLVMAYSMIIKVPSLASLLMVHSYYFNVVDSKNAVSDLAIFAQINTAATQLDYTWIERGAPDTSGSIMNVCIKCNTLQK